MPVKYVYKSKTPTIPVTMPGYYGVANIMAITGWSRQTLYRRIWAGEFPQPDISGVSKQKLYWKTSTVKDALGL